jgi:hypothetical protein
MLDETFQAIHAIQQNGGFNRMSPLTLSIKDRQHAILKLAATKALQLPLSPSGFWFHSDVRDNLYYAIHLYAYCQDTRTSPELSDQQRKAGIELAVSMINKVLALQVQDPENPMYGHWPLNLGNDPAAAKPNSLPVELMGCILILFYHKFQTTLPLGLKSELNLCFVHIYQSSVYRQPLGQIHHHEAKHTALKLLLGYQFDDQELLAQGIQYAIQQLKHVKTFGFKEYGALPWHWHWIQAFTCVWEVVDHPDARRAASEMLEMLWQLRAHYYLKGAWVGAQSRQWPHDAPKDNNTLLDYIQFGDFPMPEVITRLEGASLYTYEISDEIKRNAIQRTRAVEVKRLIRFAGVEGVVSEEAHTYAYITPDYAVGGIWERREEFDNEQQRWDVTLPLTNPAAADGVNQLLFLHPGAKYKPGDDRHASNYGEVLLHKDTVIQLWTLPKDNSELHPNLVGCLPKGDWKFEDRSGYGDLGNVYVVFHLMNDYTVEEQADRWSVSSSLSSAKNGIVVEALSHQDAEALGIHSVEDLSKKFLELLPIFQETGAPAYALSANYTTRRGDVLSLSLMDAKVSEDAIVQAVAAVNGQPMAWNDYTLG